MENRGPSGSVLEPSVGDGRFLSALLPISGEVKAIELFEKRLRMCVALSE